MTWDAALLNNADGSAVEFRIVGHGSGGNPSLRRAVEVGAVEWNAGVQPMQTVESSLYYLRARYYDPETGRFMSRDPLAEEPAWRGQKFSYANAHPTDLSDPTGLEPDREPEGIAFPPPGSLEDQERCRDGWIHCLFGIGDEFPKLTPHEISAACGDFYARCLDRVANGEEGYFEFDAVRERMRSIVNKSDIINDIIDFFPPLPRIPISPPGTGSGGLVPANKEGASFSCVR